MRKYLLYYFALMFIGSQLTMIIQAIFNGTIDKSVIIYYIHIGIASIFAREYLYPPLPQRWSTIDKPQYTRETFSIDISIYLYFALVLTAVIRYNAGLFYLVSGVFLLIICGISLWNNYKKIYLVK